MQLEIASARMLKKATEAQGEMALNLIQSDAAAAPAPTTASSGSVGRNLHIVG